MLISKKMSGNSSNTGSGEPGVLKNQSRPWVHKAVGWMCRGPYTIWSSV